MPVYNCIIPDDSLSSEKRDNIAKAFTDIHCGLTDAPRDFVHVFFHETSNTSDSTYATPYYLDAINRAGRPPELVRRLKQELMQAFCKIAGVSADQMGARIVESPAAWAMEGGAILPEPGEEGAEWYHADSENQQDS